MYIVFTEEVIFDPEFQGYLGGRVEIWKEKKPYAIDEVRVFTEKREEFKKWFDNLDKENLSSVEVQNIREKIQTNYYEELNND